MKEILLKLYRDEYSYLEGRAMWEEVQPGCAMILGIDDPELKYLDYWKWFWEGAS